MIFQKNSINICVIRKIFVPLQRFSRKTLEVEQLVARQAHNLEVARSNPASATTAAGRLLFLLLRQNSNVLSVVRSCSASLRKRPFGPSANPASCHFERG